MTIIRITALGLLGHRPWAILDRNALRNSVIGILTLSCLDIKHQVLPVLIAKAVCLRTESTVCFIHCM